MMIVLAAVLFAFCFVNLVVILALARRVRELQRGVAAGGTQDATLLRPGEAISAFTVTSTDGKPLSEDAVRQGTTLVGFFAPDCAPCAQVKAELDAAPPRLPLLAFVTGNPDAAPTRALAAQLASYGRVAFAFNEPALTDAFKPTGVPTLFRIEDGIVAASGHTLRDVAVQS